MEEIQSRKFKFRVKEQGLGFSLLASIQGQNRAALPLPVAAQPTPLQSLQDLASSLSLLSSSSSSSSSSSEFMTSKSPSFPP